MYRQCFHANIDTNNFTEGFNSSLRKYLLLRHDKSVHSLVKILLSVVFPEQEREYLELNIRQSEQYRKPINSTVPPYLLNRPQEVRAACLKNTEKAKLIESSRLKEFSNQPGTYTVTTSGGSYESSISAGKCSCPYFQKQKIPCKYMFAIFMHTKREWDDLPKKLTQAPYMTLDHDVSSTACAHDQEQTWLDDVEELQPVAAVIPPKVTPGNMIAKLQRAIRDDLAKCASMAYMVNDAPLLMEAHERIKAIHMELLQAARSNPDKENQLPVMSLLVKADLSDYRRRSKLTPRASMVLRKYRKRKANVTSPINHKRMKMGDDPLLGASRRSVGRPKLPRKKKKASIRYIQTLCTSTIISYTYLAYYLSSIQMSRGPLPGITTGSGSFSANTETQSTTPAAKAVSALGSPHAQMNIN